LKLTAAKVAGLGHFSYRASSPEALQRRAAVIDKAGRGNGWTDGAGALAQPGVAEHSFMNELADQGFLLLAGPLANSELDRIRALLIVEAADEAAIEERLAPIHGRALRSCARSA
jgi:hypothetical protein